MNMETAVKLAKEGKEEGFNYLYQSTYQKSYYVALKYMKQEDAALDVLQDAYIKAFKSLEQLEDVTKFETWFSRVVATKALDELRKRKLTLFSQVEDEDGLSFEETFEDNRTDTQPELSMDQAETTRLVKEMIDTLSDEQRMCIMMFYMEELSVKEIAETLQVSENTVKSRLNYGRKNIKEKVLELEKKGTKLYSVAPFTFFLYLLRAEAQNTSGAAATEAVAANVVAEGVKATSTISTGAGATVTARVGKAVGGIAVKKIIVGLAVVVALGGGGIALVPALSNTNTENNYNDELDGNKIDPSEEPASGDTGEVHWNFENNTLTIFGNGRMADYEFVEYAEEREGNAAPWFDKAISKIIVEEGVTYIGEYAFLHRFIPVEDDDYEVIIADSVTEIGEGAFCLTRMRNITLPKNLIRIEERTFHSCQFLKEIDIPDSVVYIGVQAFSNCQALEKVDFSNGLETIDDNAFDHCVSLKEAVLPDSLIALGNSAFMGCERLERVSISSGVSIIRGSTFSDCYSLREVRLSTGLVEIENMAFYNCQSLTSIELPEGLERLYDNFLGCSITSVVVPSTVTDIITNENIEYISE